MSIKKITKSVSFYLLLINVLLFIFTASVIPGLNGFRLIYDFEMATGLHLAGILINLFLICIAVEAIYGRIWKPLISVPLVIFVGYYVIFTYQTLEATSRGKELQNSNPRILMKYDKNLHSLVLPGENEKWRHISRFVRTHNISETFENKKSYPGEFLTYQIVLRKNCKLVPSDNLSNLSKKYIRTSEIWEGVTRVLRDQLQKNNLKLCSFSFPKIPPNPQIVVKITQQLHRKFLTNFRETIYSFEFKGNQIGKYRIETISRYKKLPSFEISCFRYYGWRWKCSFGARRETYDLDSTPKNLNVEKFEHPVSIALGIEKYSQSDLSKVGAYLEH